MLTAMLCHLLARSLLYSMLSVLGLVSALGVRGMVVLMSAYSLFDSSVFVLVFTHSLLYYLLLVVLVCSWAWCWCWHGVFVV